ncbi:MAG: 3-dehydroquinate synthase [Anaerolineae bacterium]
MKLTIDNAQFTIFLYGPSGSGKSTVGRLLADSLALPFVDLDEEIESRAGVSIPKIFAAHGESRFRELEQAQLEEVLAKGGGVVALGGGALTDPGNRALAEAAGPVLFLHAPPETLLARLGSDPANPRPLLAGDSAGHLKNLLAHRAEHYASFPLRLDTAALTPEQAAWQAQVLLGAFHVRGMGTGYDVRVRPGGLDSTGEGFHARGLHGPVGLVSDSNVGPLYAPRVQESLQKAGYRVGLVIIPAGEKHKTMETVSRLWASFLQTGLERGSTVLALGGGVVGDLAGFAAATFLRGIPWVALPTSLLAMVDASLGGKTGADLPEGKNLIGAFHPPRLVLADPEVLATLPAAEQRSGLAEVVKHGIIADPKLFRDLVDFENLSGLRWNEIVSRAMAVKIRVIQEDPYEGGRRAALNLGHTIGHAVELVSGFALRHGEAIAIGLVAEARLSERLGLAQPGLSETIAGTLRGLGLPTEIPPHLERAAIIRTMHMDKKRKGGVVRFALPVHVGEVKAGVEIDDLDSTLSEQ